VRDVVGPRNIAVRFAGFVPAQRFFDLVRCHFGWPADLHPAGPWALVLSAHVSRS
jgi:hypothetical protein